jgi:hypothetical protein
MKLSKQDRARLPVEDYSRALRSAVAWLGERYLLAVPVKARHIDHAASRYFGQARRWHERVSVKH